MSKTQDMINDVLGTINGALAILDEIPKLDEFNGNFEFGVSLSPFALIAELLKNTQGANKIIDWLSAFLIMGLGPLEVALKTLLMTNLRGLITCSLNPIIPNDLLKNGIVFDLQEIDIFNMLRYYPLDSKGRNFYFGCDEANYPDELRRSQDFNALLWYMVNRSNCRELWNKCSAQYKTEEGEYQIHEQVNDLVSGSVAGNTIPLKAIECVDIDVSKKDTDGNFIYKKDKNNFESINAKWDDVFNKGSDSTKNYLNIDKLYSSYNEAKDDEGYIYFENNVEIVYVKGDDGNLYSHKLTDLFNNNDFIYKYKVKEGTVKIDSQDTKVKYLSYDEGDYILVDTPSIERRKDYNKKHIRCGTLLQDRYGEYDLSNISDYRVPNIDGEYYYCNYTGYVTDSDGKKVKFKKLNKSFEIQKDFLTGTPKNLKISVKNEFHKLTKKAGIVTLEYHETCDTILNCEGNPTSGTSLPYRNCIQVFLGNAQPDNYGDIIRLRNEIAEAEKSISISQEKIDDQYREINEAENTFNAVKEQNTQEIDGKKSKDTSVNLDEAEEIYETTKNKCNQIIKEESNKLYKYNNIINTNRVAINSCQKYYRSYKENYYYRRTLIEFNFDYIWSLKLFDARVVLTQLIDSLFNNITLDLGFSYEQIFNHQELKETIEKLIQSDDIEINDCFFTFSNDQYNAMVVKSEKIHQGLFVTHQNQDGIQVNVDNLYEELNALNPTASKEEQQTVIKGVLDKIKGEISTQDYSETDKFGISNPFNENMWEDILNKLLTNLATVLAQSFLSPKVYLLLAVNMKIMGQQSDITIEMLIAKLKNIILDAIKLIRDQLLNFLMEKIMEIIREIAFNVGAKLALEQAMYYYNIIMKLINCFKSNTLGFTVDEVNYADIYEQAAVPPAEC